MRRKPKSTTRSNKATKKASNRRPLVPIKLLGGYDFGWGRLLAFGEAPMLRQLFVAGLLLSVTGCAASSATSSRHDGSRGIVVIETDVDATATFSGGAPHPLQAATPSAIPTVPGTYALAIESEGYLTRRYDLRVNPNEEVRIRLEMWPVVEELDE